MVVNFNFWSLVCSIFQSSAWIVTSFKWQICCFMFSLLAYSNVRKIFCL